MEKFHRALYSDNEIAKTADFNFGETQDMDNLNSSLGGLVGGTKDVIVYGGTVRQIASPSMNVQIDAFFALNRSTGKMVMIDDVYGPVAIEAADTQDRIDIIEIQETDVDYDSQQRAFKDPASGTLTYVDVNTKQKVSITVHAKKGVAGSGNPPAKTTGWVKLSEVTVPANATQIVTANIANCTATYDGEETSGWVADKAASFRLSALSVLKTAFRQNHTEAGDHKAASIKDSHIDFGVGTNQVNADDLPLGTDITIPNGTIAKATSSRAAMQTLANLIAAIADTYHISASFTSSPATIVFADRGIPDDVYSIYHQLMGANTRFVHHVAIDKSTASMTVYLYYVSKADGSLVDGTPPVKWGSKKWGAFKYGESESIAIDFFFRREE